MGLSPASRLGAFEILALAGAGGMGEVYKARDTRLDRLVAIKILPPHLASDPQFRDRFDREARTISQLDHPNICQLYDVGEQDGTSFLVMQYLEGETLADRLSRGACGVARRGSSISRAGFPRGLARRPAGPATSSGRPTAAVSRDICRRGARSSSGQHSAASLVR